MFSFTIRDLLWLTVVVAAFLGGRSWDRGAKYLAQPPALKVGPVIRLANGRSGTISTPVAASRCLCSDPTVISIVPMTPTKFEIVAKSMGTCTLTFWEPYSDRAMTYKVAVDR